MQSKPWSGWKCSAARSDGKCCLDRAHVREHKCFLTNLFFYSNFHPNKVCSVISQQKSLFSFFFFALFRCFKYFTKPNTWAQSSRARLIAFPFPHAGTESWVGTVKTACSALCLHEPYVSDVPFFSLFNQVHCQRPTQGINSHKTWRKQPSRYKAEHAGDAHKSQGQFDYMEKDKSISASGSALFWILCAPSLQIMSQMKIICLWMKANCAFSKGKDYI